MIARSDARGRSEPTEPRDEETASASDRLATALERIGRIYAELLDVLDGTQSEADVSAPAADPAEVSALLAGHQERAQRLWDQIRENAGLRAAFEATLDWLAFGLLVVDSEARVLAANRRARELLCLGDGIRESAGRIVGSRSEVTRQIRAGVEAAIASEEHAARLLVVERDAARALELFIDPLPDSAREGRVRLATIGIGDPDAAVRIPPQWLRDLYGLTPRESEVASLLAEGRRLGDIAEALGISLNTVKVRLQAVFEKTGTHRQAELARRLADQATRIPPTDS